MDTFQVHILAADRTFYEGPCVSLTVPTNDGERGILAHHSSMIAAIQPGTLRYQAPGQPIQLAAISPGMVKVSTTMFWCWWTPPSGRRRLTWFGPSGRRTRPVRRCCRRRAGRSTRLPRPPWPGH